VLTLGAIGQPGAGPNAVLDHFGLAQTAPGLGWSTTAKMGRGVLDRDGPRWATLKWAITDPRVGQLRGPKV
jgi:hypothetical protein